MWAIRKLDAGPGSFSTRLPVPVPGDDDVLIRVRGREPLWDRPAHLPLGRLGAAKRIQPPLTFGATSAPAPSPKSGSNVRSVAEGDYVSAESHVTCGICFHCRTGQAHMCELTQILGVDRDGAFAEFVVVPESVIWPNDRTKLPPEIATLQEPFGNAVFATSKHDLAGKTVAILGCGPVGLFTSPSRAPREPGACLPRIASPFASISPARWASPKR